MSFVKSMRSKGLPGRTLLLIIVLTGSVLSLALLFYFIPKKSTQNGLSPLATNTITALPAPRVGKPARLKIPGISVDSAVEYVGLTADGAMDVPKDPDNVAWLELGRRPGENGSAVIAGHYGTWKNGKGSVFDNLHKLSEGDKLSIEDDKGTVISFAVRESRKYDPEADASDVFSSDDGRSHLNLITCEGVWNEDLQSYSSRLVVFADKE